MRLIDLDGLRPLIADKIPALNAAHDAVMNAKSAEDRDAVIRRHRRTWVALRDAMSKYSHGKCWYTECRNPGTDDDVDHFRPKGAVKDSRKEHPGYYWLAFDWRNFRYSCHRANRPRSNAVTGELGGKSSSFPLVDEERRAYTPDDDWRAEYPALLDPTDPHDPPFLTFLANGDADLASVYKDNQVALERFECSRLGLHLNWPEFSEARMQLYHYVANLVDRGQRQAPTNIASGDGDREAFKDTLRDLTKLMTASAEYSAAARAYVEAHRNVWWIDQIVLRAVA